MCKHGISITKSNKKKLNEKKQRIIAKSLIYLKKQCTFNIVGRKLKKNRIQISYKLNGERNVLKWADIKKIITATFYFDDQSAAIQPIKRNYVLFEKPTTLSYGLKEQFSFGLENLLKNLISCCTCASNFTL